MLRNRLQPPSGLQIHNPKRIGPSIKREHGLKQRGFSCAVVACDHRERSKPCHLKVFESPESGDRERDHVAVMFRRRRAV